MTTSTLLSILDICPHTAKRFVVLMFLRARNVPKGSSKYEWAGVPQYQGGWLRVSRPAYTAVLTNSHSQYIKTIAPDVLTSGCAISSG